jgi:uncharacterized protein (DUF488 family)
MIHTIGYQGKSIQEFCDILEEYNIQILIDVRSHPTSYNDDYTKYNLAFHLNEFDIEYRWAGEYLGGRPLGDFYDDTGKLKYSDKLLMSEKFRRGILRVLELSQDEDVVLMCMESHPAECHRSYILGKYLKSLGHKVIHIIDKELYVDQKFMKQDEQLQFQL